MAKVGQLIPLTTTPGVQPLQDSTPSSTEHYTYSDKIRWVDGFAEKIGGWASILFDYGYTIDGVARSLYTEFINGKYYTGIGTNTKLYSLIGSRLDNITPLLTTSVAASNSLSTQYSLLVLDPFQAQIGMPTVIVLDPEAARFAPGDIVYFSGVVGFAGIPAGNINGDNIVRTVGSGFYTINVGVNANATTIGGGAVVVRSSGLINVSSAAHGQVNGDRVKISGAATTGGVTNSQINNEFNIRNVAVNSFDIMTLGQSSSLVTSGGGTGTVYFKEIPDGLVNETNAQGYGAGLYGAGLYGTALLSTTARSYPRIWFDDRYGNTIVMTPGNQTGVYQWFGNDAVAPVLIANAPTAVNYLFVSDNIIVTFGAGGIENRIFASDNTDITVWTSSSTNQVYDDDIEGAGRLTSHCPVEDYNLIFTEFKTYKFRYIGLPFVWEITPVDETVGIIAPMARVSVKGMAFWMGSQNFYMYRGGTVEIIPANSQNQSTCHDYVFENINWGQKSKCFAWYNKAFNEIWFHYPSAASNEPDSVVKVNILDYTWSIDQLNRTAAEYPNTKLVNPRLMNFGTLYKHEFGYNDDGNPMAWTLSDKKQYMDNNTANQLNFIPDSNQLGNINVNVKSWLYPQSQNTMYNENYTVSPTTERVPTTSNGRYYQMTYSGNTLDQYWEMGQWMQDPDRGASN